MANDLAPSGTSFVSRPHPLHPRTLEWALTDKQSGGLLTEYKKDKRTAKASYIDKYGPSGHQPRGTA